MNTKIFAFLESQGRTNHALLLSPLIALLLSSIVSIKALGQQKCPTFKSSKELSASLFPDHMPQEFIVLSFFENNTYTLEVHKAILNNLAANTKALILIAGNFNTNNPDSQKTESKMLISYRKIMSDSSQQFKKHLAAGKINFLQVPMDLDFKSTEHANWTRDFLSQLVVDKNGRIKMLNLRYHRSLAESTDSFTTKYLLDYLNKKYSQKLGYKISSLNVPFYLEWGNFISDGAGNFFLSKKLFEINEILGKKISESMVESWFLATFGQQAKLHWIDMPKSIRTGHVDMAIRFVDCSRVIVAATNHPLLGPQLTAIADLLKDLNYRVTRIPVAFTEYEIENSLSRTFRSYTNSTIIGDVVYVPKYDAGHGTFESFDAAAEKTYRTFGFKDVIMVDANEAISQGAGAVHCLTSQFPNLEFLNPAAE
jgi:agmatine/peptidylarginine deiminase